MLYAKNRHELSGEKHCCGNLDQCQSRRDEKACAPGVLHALRTTRRARPARPTPRAANFVGLLTVASWLLLAIAWLTGSATWVTGLVRPERASIVAVRVGFVGTVAAEDEHQTENASSAPTMRALLKLRAGCLVMIAQEDKGEVT